MPDDSHPKYTFVDFLKSAYQRRSKPAETKQRNDGTASKDSQLIIAKINKTPKENVQGTSND